MSKRLLAGSMAAAFLSGAIAINAQAPGEKTGQKADEQASAAGAISVTGCVQKETSVLKGNPVASAMGMSDEFVLTNTALHRGTTSMVEPTPDTQPPPAEPVGTSGSASNFGKVYRVTGDKENELKPYVGQRVEIAGTFKHDEDAKAELGTVGTSGRSITGEITKANTPEITISSIHPVAGSCPAVAPR
jgi:hypothetical protein